jgi:hypothetical protein
MLLTMGARSRAVTAGAEGLNKFRTARARRGNDRSILRLDTEAKNNSIQGRNRFGSLFDLHSCVAWLCGALPGLLCRRARGGKTRQQAPCRWTSVVIERPVLPFAQKTLWLTTEFAGDLLSIGPSGAHRGLVQCFQHYR